MEWSDRMNAAISYIEDNLTEEIDYNLAAQKACCSIFHFQRMFSAIIGLTPAEYVRRRRLTLAARELTSTKARVIDVAMKYGYDSPVSFGRAFRNTYGVTPQAAREPGVTLAAYPRVSFKIVLIGGNDMDYKIIEKPAFETIGRGRKYSGNQGENFVKIPQFWGEYMASAEYQELLKLTGQEPGPVTGGGCLGVMVADSSNWESFTYAICIEKAGNAGGDFELYKIPAASWAVFDCTLSTIQDITRRIFNEWFPSTGYEHDSKPEIEVYFPQEPGSKEMRCQVWIPIIKKITNNK